MEPMRLVKRDCALDSAWGPASPAPTRDAGVCVGRGSRGSGYQGPLFITGRKQSKSRGGSGVAASGDHLCKV